MKLHGLLIVLLLLCGTVLSAQTALNLFFSEYVEGSSNNKAIEIFNGTGAPVDLTQYTIKLGSNGGTWSTTNICLPTGMLANNDVYVIANSAANAAILAQADITSTVTYFNGDDCLGLWQYDGIAETLIDVIGVYLTDPGTAWDVAGVVGATLNHTLIRKPSVTEGNLTWVTSAGTNADDSEWIVFDQDYITDLGMHTFGATNNVATPVFTPGSGTYTTPQSVTITCSTPNSSIFYTTDGSTPTPASTPYSGAILVGTATTLKAMATASGMDNSNVATAIYAFPVTVSNLTALRALPADGTTIYNVTGQVVLTFKQTFRNQKYLQDSGAGILVDDLAGVITTTYNVGDGVTGLTGKISEFGGMLQFVPTANTPAASSTGNVITPVVASYDQLINNFDTYESRVTKVTGVSFTAPTGNFANGVVYATSDPNSDYNIRTTFYDVDYINTPIPTTVKDITGIPNSRVDGAYFTPRTLADIADPAGAIASPTFSVPTGVYTNSFNVTVSTETTGADIYFTLDGSIPNDTSAYYEEAIAINATTTLKAIAYMNGEFSAVSTAVYTFPVNVASLLALRESPLQGVYRITDQVIVTFTQSFRNQKFVQDDTAGIQIDDLNGVITTAYQEGFGMTNLTGTLIEFGGMLELVPVADPGAPSSTGNMITPLAITLSQFNDDFEAYESRLIKLVNVSFTTPTGNFANGTNYPIQDQSAANTANIRTTFYDVDYISVPLQSWMLNLTGIPNSRTDGSYFTPRKLSDFQISEPLTPLVFATTVQSASTLAFHIGFDVNNNSVLPDMLTGYNLYRDGTVIHSEGSVLFFEFVDTNIPVGTHTYYAIAHYGATNSDPTQEYTFIVTAIGDENPALPTTALLGNYPNPFNPSTDISFSVKDASPVRVDIFNQKGQLVRTLLDASRKVGTHTVNWDGKDSSGNGVSSGVYYYRMKSGSFSSTRKMLLLK